VPRRLEAPELGDEQIRLEPLTRSLAPEMQWVIEPDEGIARFTFLPTEPDDGFLVTWLGRYEDGWQDGTRAGFAVRDEDGANAGFAAFVRLDLGGREGEIGYVVAPARRGRGLARRAVDLLTRWGFDELNLARIELRIDPANTGSNLVAERAGYTREGVLRSVAFKEGGRADVGVWSRLAAD
jgi:RimJ/RimL family protein N-acetyltransferase